MLNALKYASAFPVIILSAMQSVNGSPLEEADETMGDSWMNKNTLFSLWLVTPFIPRLCISIVKNFIISEQGFGSHGEFIIFLLVGRNE
jgi:hypothetical protein